MENLVEIKNNQVITSSRQVAECFGKRHDKLLFEIKRMYSEYIVGIGMSEMVETPLFYEHEYMHPQNNQKYKEYLMNRDGFSLLVMGFTGKEALQWKIKYIEAFNTMEQELLQTRKQLPNFDDPVAAARAWANEVEAKRRAQKQIEEDRPKVLFADAVATAKTSILIGELAKLIKQNGYDIGQKRLFNFLREKGYLIKRKGIDYNMPTQKSMNLGLFEIKERTINHTDHVEIVKTTKVTGKGQIYFINLFDEMQGETA